MKKSIIFTIVLFANFFKRISLKHDTLIKLNFLPGFEKWRWYLGQCRTYVAYYQSVKSVPALKTLHNENKIIIPFIGLTPIVSVIPTIDKDSYVKRFSLDNRCIGGELPTKGVVVDESSGSTGKPTSWVRGKFEREQNKRMIEFGIRHNYGEDNLFIVNAFAMGAWATGVNVTMSCVDISMIKSLGPDQEKIENTLKDFGPKYRYIIMGYPPFLKILVDQIDIDWEAYDIHFIFGGEAMSEALRVHLLKKGIKSVRSSLGASDLELNIALENDFTMELRRKIVDNKDLAKEILGYSGATPMIFQYNPAEFYMETSDEGELIISICREGYLAPKIRYNLHDKAEILRKSELLEILDRCGLSLDDFENEMILDLPILLHYGRSDMTVSYFGSNISPSDVNDSLCQIESFSDQFAAFKIQAYEDKQANKQLNILVELHEGRFIKDYDVQDLETHFLNNLASNNQDFREALSMMPKSSYPQVKLYKNGHTIFSDNDIKIKLKYIVEAA